MKNALIGIGALAILGGIGYYFYTKSKQGSAASGGTGDVSATDTAGTSSGGEEITPPAPKTPPTAAEEPAALSKKEKRKEARADSKTFKSECGRKPASHIQGFLTGGLSNINRKKKIAVWQRCVDKEKQAQSSSFEGGEEISGLLTDLN